MSRGELKALFEAGKRGCPGLEVEEVAFVAYARRFATEAGVSAADLYLAAGCALGIPDAMAMLERRYARVLERTAARAAAFGVSTADFRQELRMVLFVQKPGGAHIEKYRGSGPLGGWLQVLAARTAMQMIDRRRKVMRTELPEETLPWERAALSDTDIERAVARNEARVPFERALTAAAASIASEDRALLRQYYAHGTGIDGLARLLGVHRSNASRALARARAALLSAVRRSLTQQLGLLGEDIDSLIRLMRSDLGVSLSVVLESDQQEPDER